MKLDFKKPAHRIFGTLGAGVVLTCTVPPIIGMYVSPTSDPICADGPKAKSASAETLIIACPKPTL